MPSATPRGAAGVLQVGAGKPALDIVPAMPGPPRSLPPRSLPPGGDLADELERIGVAAGETANLRRASVLFIDGANPPSATARP